MYNLPTNRLIVPPRPVKKKYGFENPFKVDPLIRRAVKYLPRTGTLLDVGCGEGADSVHLARKGFAVTSLDRNGDYLRRLRRYCRSEEVPPISIRHRNVVTFGYPKDAYDVVISILALCCMKRSEAARVVRGIRGAVKPGGLVVLSARNHLDPEYADFRCEGCAVERNTYRNEDYACSFIYFLEENKLRDFFRGFRVLYYYEGFAPCKYGEHPKHGDSYIICRRPR